MHLLWSARAHVLSQRGQQRRAMLRKRQQQPPHLQSSARTTHRFLTVNLCAVFTQRSDHCRIVVPRSQMQRRVTTLPTSHHTQPHATTRNHTHTHNHGHTHTHAHARTHTHTSMFDGLVQQPHVAVSLFACSLPHCEFPIELRHREGSPRLRLALRGRCTQPCEVRCRRSGVVWEKKPDKHTRKPSLHTWGSGMWHVACGRLMIRSIHTRTADTAFVFTPCSTMAAMHMVCPLDTATCNAVMPCCLDIDRETAPNGTVRFHRRRRQSTPRTYAFCGVHVSTSAKQRSHDGRMALESGEMQWSFPIGLGTVDVKAIHSQQQRHNSVASSPRSPMQRCCMLRHHKASARVRTTGVKRRVHEHHTTTRHANHEAHVQALARRAESYRGVAS